MSILLIEDNLSISQGLQYAFAKNNYEIVVKQTIEESKVYLNNHNPEIIVLDVCLSDGDGFSFYEEVIKPKKIPTIFLTARDSEFDVVKGLSLGAEDYMTKPFSTKELLVRVNKIILRNKKISTIKVKDISFDLDKMVVKKDNIPIDLSSLELRILHLLFINIGKVVRRDTIIDKIWEWTGNDVYDHTITVYLKRIREKLKTKIITTVKGLGYRIDEE